VKAPTRWITFGSWMGGDRDGNPNVTPSVTANTLMLHRQLALQKLSRSLRELSRLLSVSSRLDGISPELERWLKADEEPDPHVRALKDRYPHEPYRLALAAMRSRLLAAEDDEEVSWLLSPNASEKPEDVLKTKDIAQVLDLIANSLTTHRGALLAEGELHGCGSRSSFSG